jgi:hypothetical protein
MAVKVFNGLPYNLKEFSNNPKQFKANLKGFLKMIVLYLQKMPFTRFYY